MIILEKTRNIISLINAISIVLYFSIQPQAVQTCRASSSRAPRPNVFSDSDKLSMYITPTAPLISSALLDILNSIPQTTTDTYLQHTVSSFTEHAVSSSIGAEAYYSSTVGSGIARNCLYQSNEFYNMCIRKAIIRSPYLAVRYAGRNLRVAQICHKLALRHLEGCQKLLFAAS